MTNMKLEYLTKQKIAYSFLGEDGEIEVDCEPKWVFTDSDGFRYITYTRRGADEFQDIIDKHEKVL